MFSQYLLPLLLLPLAQAEDDCVTVEAEDPGQWQGLVQLGPFQEDVTNWNIMISFSSHLDWMESVMADVSGEERTWVLSSKDWDGDISAGESLGVRFVVGYSGTKPVVTSVSYDTAACEGMVVVTEEMEGQWAGQISLQAGPNTISGWTVEMEFTSSVDWIESVMAQVSGGGSQWSLSSRDWDQDIPAGSHLDLQFLVDFSSLRPSVLSITFNGNQLCSGGEVCLAPTPPTPPTTPSTTASPGCCGVESFRDPLCNDPPTDPNGGLGCKACGIQDCRLCGQGVYIPCPSGLDNLEI